MNVAGLFRIRNLAPAQVGFNGSLLFGRGSPGGFVFQGNRVALGESEVVEIGPGDHIVDVLVFALAVVQKLMDNLHGPVGAAFDVHGHEDIVTSGDVAPEGIVLQKFLALPAAHRPQRLLATAEQIHDGRHRPENPVYHQTHYAAEDHGRLAALEAGGGHMFLWIIGKKSAGAKRRARASPMVAPPVRREFPGRPRSRH